AWFPCRDPKKPRHTAGGAIDRKGGGTQPPARRPAATHRAKAGSPQLAAAQDDLDRILDHHDIAARGPVAGARPHGRGHLRHAHPPIAQKPMELNLTAATPSQPTDPRARLFHQGSVQQRPPFSRRRSPNRPNSKTASTLPSGTNHFHQGVSLYNSGQQRCVHVIAAKAGVHIPETGVLWTPTFVGVTRSS